MKGWVWEDLKLPPEQAEGKHKMPEATVLWNFHPALLPQDR